MTTSIGGSRSPSLRWTAILTALLFAATGAIAGGSATAALAAPTDPPTTVSLTFDDGNANQTAAIDTMNELGLKGTFFITTGWIGAPGYLSVPQLTTMEAAGHEIAGHTVTHPDLATVTEEAAKRDICDGRATLAGWGFDVTSFAYPFASSTASNEVTVAECGYNSARGLGDIESRFGCAGCGFAETIPPANVYDTSALDQVDATWTLADLQAGVLNAEENGGGWVQYTFHDICDNACSPLAITPQLFEEFATWLAPRAATENTVVKTVDATVGGDVKPVVTVGAPTPAGPGVNGVVNASLETPGESGLPQCWTLAGFGTNTPTAETVSPGRTGSAAARVTLANRVDGDAKLMLAPDLGDCAPTVAADRTYSMRAWYTSTVPTQFDVSLRNTQGVWSYWTSSPYFEASASYTQAIWQTPAVPAGFTGIRFGLNLFQDGEITTDDYALYDSVGAPPANALVAGTPSVSGTAEVGSTLTANPGNWTPAGTTFAYQWLSGGADISGATSATYSPVAADVGKRISVRVTGSNAAAVPTSLAAVSGETDVVATGAPAAITVDRLAGTDRFGTAVAISQAFAPGVSRVYVATGYGFADALSAAPAAAKFASPLLLTNVDSVPANIAAEIDRLDPAEIIVVGGTAAVSDAVLTRLNAIAPTSRVAGVDRFQTSLAVTRDAFGDGATTAYLATGANYPDALAAAPAAAQYAGPLILVPGGEQTANAATRGLLEELNVTDVKIAGGTQAVSAGMEASLRGAYDVERTAGVDRYNTAIAINAAAFGSSQKSYLAVGSNFADALVGAALAGTQRAPLFLTQTECLTPGVAGQFERLQSSSVTLLGGTDVLSAKVARLESCG